jgi:pyridoxal phosphate enzyme (YggS family)
VTERGHFRDNADARLIRFPVEMPGVRDRLAHVRERIARAADRAGRDADTVALIAVSKTFDPSTVQEAVDAGVTDLGENRVQEAATKAQLVAGLGVRWHLIGHLQSNKARLAVSTFDLIHTVDSRKLAARLDGIAGELGRRLGVLIQVDLAREPTKSGADAALEVPGIVQELDSSRHLNLLGLMTMPPLYDDPESTRSYFRRLREILEEINSARPPERRLTELSMGMSRDFEVAIEEGATMVRVGTAIFGGRAARQS